jgi:1-phosphatidylinositol-3-phosphate 5-kinase
MFFDGCPPELGCTVSLRGGNRLVLAKVKKIIQFVTYVAHSQKLEVAFLMDEFALPIEPSHFYASVVSTTTDNESVKEKRNDDESATNGDTASHEETLDEATIFQQALDRTVLSSSPYVKYPLPYLLTLEGSKCAVRSRLPKEIYWSARLTNQKHANHLTEKELEEFELPNLKRNANKGVHILEAHPLVLSSVVINSHSQFIQGIVADFRSQGGRIQLKRRNTESDGRRKSKWLMLDLDDVEEEKKSDVADGRTSKASNTEKKNRKVSSIDVKCKRQDAPATPVHFNRKVSSSLTCMHYYMVMSLDEVKNYQKSICYS